MPLEPSNKQAYCTICGASQCTAIRTTVSATCSATLLATIFRTHFAALACAEQSSDLFTIVPTIQSSNKATISAAELRTLCATFQRSIMHTHEQPIWPTNTGPNGATQLKSFLSAFHFPYHTTISESIQPAFPNAQFSSYRASLQPTLGLSDGKTNCSAQQRTNHSADDHTIVAAFIKSIDAAQLYAKCTANGGTFESAINAPICTTIACTFKPAVLHTICTAIAPSYSTAVIGTQLPTELGSFGAANRESNGPANHETKSATK